MNCPERITKALAEAAGEPKAIYLGRREWRELRDYAAEVCCFFVEAPHTQYHRCTFRGKAIFLVDAEEHLGAA